MTDFTVAICTYNGENRITDVLNKLGSQVNVEHLDWEIIIIDNNSQDNTAEVVKQHQINWQQSYPLKYYFESTQGLAYARKRAVRESQSPLIGFLDDDNLPDPHWVANAHSFGQQHPQAGAYGGQIHGKFEIEPPPNFARIARFFALIEGQKTYCFNQKYQNNKKRMFPPGAGIVIRKQAWLESVADNFILPQTNEDLEILSQIWNQGWEIWFNSQMHIEHMIPKARFEKLYLKSFFRQNGLCRYHFRMLNYQPWQIPIIALIYAIADFFKIINHLLKYGATVKTDLVAAAELELLIYLFFSPFYYWKQLFNSKFQ
jgi:glycosyltransferase involved in cell wall biosynthesis